MWKPEGLDFEGVPGEVLHFELAGNLYRVVFGPNTGEGLQENLRTGRRRNLRLAIAGRQSIPASEVAVQEVAPKQGKGSEGIAVEQLCEMGFSRIDAMHALQAARGNTGKAVDYLFSAARS